MNRQKAIDLNCNACIYDKAEPGNWRQQVEACTASDTCTLWEHRPLTERGQAVRKQALYEAMTPIQQESYKKRQETAKRLHA